MQLCSQGRINLLKFVLTEMLIPSQLNTSASHVLGSSTPIHSEHVTSSGPSSIILDSPNPTFIALDSICQLTPSNNHTHSLIMQDTTRADNSIDESSCFLLSISFIHSLLLLLMKPIFDEKE